MGAGSSANALRKARESDEYAEKIFKNIDANGDGALTVVELWDAAFKYGEAVDGDWQLDTIKEAITRFDANGDGIISESEFIAVLTRPVPGQPAHFTVPQAKARFKQVDLDGSGSVEYEECAPREIVHAHSPSWCPLSAPGARSQL